MSSFLINNRTLPAINWSQMSWEFMHFLWGEMKDRQPETRKKMKTRRWNTLKRAKMEKCPSLASLKTAGNKQKSQQYQRIPEEATWLLSNIDRNVVNVRWLHLRLIRIKICSRVIATTTFVFMSSFVVFFYWPLQVSKCNNVMMDKQVF